MFDTEDDKKIVLYGIGYFASQINRYLIMEGIHISAFTVEQAFCDKDVFQGIPVIPFENLKQYYSINDIKIIVCIGYNMMNQARAKVFSLIKEHGFEIGSYIHPSATILSDALGEGNIVLENVNISIGCSIGNGNVLFNNVVISHDTRIGDFNYFAPSSTVLGTCDIRNNCFLGGNSTIKNKSFIDDYTLVGANAFVRINTKKYSVIVPAKSIELDTKSTDMIQRIM